MSVKKIISRSLHCTLAAALTAHAGSAAAIEFDMFGTTYTVDSLLTIGASWRMQERDSSLIGKASLHRLNNPITATGSPQGLCYTRTNDDGVNGPQRNTDEAGENFWLDRGVIPAGCSTSNANAIRDFVARPGSYNPSGDNGNLNFDKGDVVHAIAKLTTDISFSVADFNVFVRPIYFFDANYTDDFLEQRPDTTLQSSTSPLPEATEDTVGESFDVLDYHISTAFDVFDRGVSIRLGNQVLNWGESSFLALNSLNTINPPDARRLNMPGLDLKEAFQPVGMLVLGTDLFQNASIETFYQYDWRPVIVDPPGSFFSVSDTLGAGGFYAQNGQGREPDDPEALYRGIDTCREPDTFGPCVNVAGTLGSTSSRIVPRNFEEERNRRPNDGGQYGAALRLFLEDFNNGTELAFYYANYHSRLPLVSAIASTVRSCITNQASLAPGGECGYKGPGVDADNDLTPENEETLPVDTLSIFVEYPENIDLYGVSFNTTLGDYALSGEVAYRPKLPTQIHTLDISLAALGPSFPENDVNLGVGTLGQRAAFPDFVSVYRGLEGGYDNGDYIRGYEELETAQYNLTVLRLIGGDNPLAASQMTFLLETGMTQVFNMPGLDELQFQGGGVDTPISSGADGSTGINPRDIRSDPNDPTTSRYDINCPDNLNPNRNGCPRQNATAHKDLRGFGSDISYGYRLLNLTRWDSALFGANLETLALIRHDVYGTSPGIGTNFIHGRKQFNLGLRFDYLATWVGEVRYTWFTGGANRDAQRDRDNIFVTLGYQF